MLSISLLKFNATIQTVRIQNETYHLYVPDAASVKQEYENNRSDNHDTAFPYWARLWPSAIALSTFIVQHPDFVAGKQVMEIAAGLGLPSLVAARLASSVHCSDMDADAVEMAAASAAAAQLNNLHCEVLNWNDIPSHLPADTLLLSDVNYEPEAFDALQRLLQHFLQQGTTILLATPQRLMAVAFVNTLQEFVAQQSELEVPTEKGSTRISIFVLRQ